MILNSREENANGFEESVKQFINRTRENATLIEETINKFENHLKNRISPSYITPILSNNNDNFISTKTNFPTQFLSSKGESEINKTFHGFDKSVNSLEKDSKFIN